MPELNPYQEMIAPWNDREERLPWWRLTVSYRLKGAEEDDVREQLVTLKAPTLDDAIREAEDMVQDAVDDIEEIIDVIRNE